MSEIVSSSARPAKENCPQSWKSLFWSELELLETIISKKFYNVGRYSMVGTVSINSF